VDMRERLGLAGRRPLILAALLAALGALGPAAGSAHAVKLTYIGDSKAAAIEFSPAAKRLLARGHTVRRDLKVCRRLVAPSCPYQGVTPTTALRAIRNYGTGLGTVLVIDVGYNDTSSTYRGQLNQVMRAALNRGVKGVVWVNLRAWGLRPAHPDYAKINAIIGQSLQRWPQLYLANWNAYTRGKPASWFGHDGIHLTSAGAVGLVRLVRKWIPRAAEGPRPLTAQLGFDYPAGPGTFGEVVFGSSQTSAEVRGGAQLIAHSPAVGSNLTGASDGITGLRGVLTFAGGAAIMLFLIVVTTQAARRRLS
jgi:hypothetical protein